MTDGPTHMAYRDDLAALEAQHAAIVAALSERGTLELAKELSDLEARLRQRRLKVLDRIDIASPCDARWEAMEGDGPVRRCHRCDKHVYDLAGMTSEAALALFSREGDSACIRLRRRRDGTVITSDCDVGRERHNRRGLALAGGTLLTATAFAIAASPACDAPAEVTHEAYSVGQVVFSDPDRPTVSFDEDTFLHGWDRGDDTSREPRLQDDED